MSYEELVEKVAKVRYTAALSDSHASVMRAQKARISYERKAKQQGFDMGEFNRASRDLYLNLVFKD